jgi:hypothetical protein
MQHIKAGSVQCTLCGKISLLQCTMMHMYAYMSVDRKQTAARKDEQRALCVLGWLIDSKMLSTNLHRLVTQKMNSHKR